MVYSNFLEDMGERPEGMSLERKDNSKGYSKDNCCWITLAEQAKNRTKPSSRNRICAEIAREIKVKLYKGGRTVKSIAEEYCVSIDTVSGIKRGFTWKEVANV
jgi:hypothetical protein